MPRVRVLLAILVLLAGSVLAAGCAPTDQPGAGGPGDTTVTTPPPPGATPPTVTPSPTTPTPGSAPLLVWPATTSVAVPRPVTVWPGSPNLLQLRLEPAQAHTDNGRPTLTATELGTEPWLPVLRQYRLIGDFEGVVSYGLRLRLRRPNLHVTELTGPSRLVVDLAHQRLASTKVVFLHRPNYTAGRQPELVTALRAITPARVGQGALARSWPARAPPSGPAGWSPSAPGPPARPWCASATGSPTCGWLAGQPRRHRHRGHPDHGHPQAVPIGRPCQAV